MQGWKEAGGGNPKCLRETLGGTEGCPGFRSVRAQQARLERLMKRAEHTVLSCVARRDTCGHLGGIYEQSER